MKKGGTLGISYAPGFAADFPPEVSEFYQRTHRVRFKNSDTSDKKTSRTARYNEIPRVHYNVLSESFLHLLLRPIFRQPRSNFINVRTAYASKI